MKYILTAIAFLVLLFVEPVMNGWALTKLWTWFVVSKFSMPPLSIPEAIGIGLVVSFLTHQTIDCKKKSEESELLGIMVKAYTTALLKPLFAVLFGDIVTHWL